MCIAPTQHIDQAEQPRHLLAQREAAIVSPLPGTTRDVLEVSLDIGGMPTIVADTAGLHETEDMIEQIGIQRARAMYGPRSYCQCCTNQNTGFRRQTSRFAFFPGLN